MLLSILILLAISAIIYALAKLYTVIIERLVGKVSQLVNKQGLIVVGLLVVVHLIS